MSKQEYNGSELVVKSLKELKVKYIFGYPGGSVLDLYDALFQQDDIEHILVRHEQAATHMADGYARATGEVGVVLATSGPGATNCVTGIATAYMDSIPMVVLSGQVPTSLIGDDAFQETDIVGCSRPIVKHSFNCRSASEIPNILAKAFYIASTGRPGPVVVELPKDMLNPELTFAYNFPAATELRTYNPNTKGHSKQIRKAVTAILEAKKLVIYSGGGIVLSNTSEQLTHLVESLNAPITNTLMGLGGISGVHPNFIGMLGMHGTLEANKAMANADVILALGARFDDRVLSGVSALWCVDRWELPELQHFQGSPPPGGLNSRLCHPTDFYVGSEIRQVQQDDSRPQMWHAGACSAVATHQPSYRSPNLKKKPVINWALIEIPLKSPAVPPKHVSDQRFGQHF